MKIKVNEGWMRGIFVDENNNEYTYISNDEITDKCLFVDKYANYYIETKRDDNDVVIEIRGIK